jgi:hypothetical protein
MAAFDDIPVVARDPFADIPDSDAPSFPTQVITPSEAPPALGDLIRMKAGLPPNQPFYDSPQQRGIATTLGGIVPRSLDDLVAMTTLPRPSEFETKDLPESEQLGQAWRGELGPEAQAQSISGSLLQALPLVHLPFADIPFRATPADVELADQISLQRAQAAQPPPIPPEYAERRFTMQDTPPEQPPQLAPAPPIEQTLSNIGQPPPFNPELGPQPQPPDFQMPLRQDVPVQIGKPLQGVPFLGANGETPALNVAAAQPQVQPQPEPQAAPQPVIPPGDERYAGVSTKNEYTGGRREILGMEPAPETVPRSDQAVQDAADAVLARNPESGRGLAGELSQTPRPITDTENAVLSRHIAGLEKTHADLVEHINKTQDVGATEQLNKVRDDLQQAFQAARNTGTELGRGLRQRQVEEAAQYTLPKMEAERRAVNGGRPLSKEQLKQVEDVYNRMREAERKLNNAEKAVANGKIPRARKGLVEFLDKQAEAARQRIIERRGRLNVGFDPTALADEVIVGASHIARGLRNFDAWSSQMLQEFGDRINPYLRQLYEKAMQAAKTAAKTVKTGRAPTGETADAIKEFERLHAYKARTLKETEALQQKVATGDVSPTPSRAALALDPQAQKFRAEYQKAKYDYQVMLEKDRLANRPALKKLIDTAVDLERSIKLTGIKTFGKLGSAGGARVAQTVAEETVGKAMSLVPGLRRIMQTAPTEGTPTLRSAAAYVRGGLQGLKEIPGVIRGDVPSSDVTEGGPVKISSALDIPGRLHGAVKQPFRKAQESMALQKAVAASERAGQLEKPGAIEQAQQLAKTSGLRAIMTNDNVLSNGWNSFVTALEHNKTFPTGGYAAARVMRFLLPIVRVPTNIALEVGNMSTGLVTATGKLAQVMARGMETLKPEEADLIARHYKKGLVGAGLFLTGYFNADKFAGFWQGQSKKADKIARGGMQPGQAKFGVMTIPDWLIMHSPAGLMMQFGATVKKYQDTHKSFTTSAMAGASEILHEVPFINEMSRIDNLLKSNWEGESARGNLVKGSVVPQGVQNVADWLDPYKRKATTPMEHIQSGIPVWRERLPITKNQPPVQPSPLRTKVRQALQMQP